MLYLMVFLHLKDTLVATFKEKGKLTFRKYVVQLNINIQNLSKKYILFWSDSCVFSKLLVSKILFLKDFLPVKNLR